MSKGASKNKSGQSSKATGSIPKSASVIVERGSVECGSSGRKRTEDVGQVPYGLKAFLDNRDEFERFTVKGGSTSKTR